MVMSYLLTAFFLTGGILCLFYDLFICRIQWSFLFVGMVPDFVDSAGSARPLGGGGSGGGGSAHFE